MPRVWTLGLLALAVGACQPDTLDPLPPTGRLEGYLCDPARDELAAGAIVVGEGPAGEISDEADATGFVQLDALFAGEQILQVERLGDAWEVTVEIPSGALLRLPDPECLDAPTGSVSGRICAVESAIGSGEGFWLSGAAVQITVGAEVFGGTTDADGHFALSAVPVGTHVLQVTKGSFSASVEVTVHADEVTTLDYVCVQPTTQMLVITGVFDAVEDILRGLGFGLRSCETQALHADCPASPDPTGQITLYDGIEATSTAYITDVLANGGLDDFDIVFFNCGLNDTVLLNSPPEVGENLRAFVWGGGSIYVSDYAYEVIPTFFGDALDEIAFEGGVSPKVGVPVIDPPVSATVVEPGLAARVGTSVDLVYEQVDWVALAIAQPEGVTVWVQGDVQVDLDGPGGAAPEPRVGAPLLVSVAYGEGRLVFTTFHNHAQSSADMQEVLRHLVFEL